METVERFTTTAAVETAWRLLADVEHWKDWNPTIVEITPISGTGLRVGAKYRVVQPELPPGVYEVTECRPNEAFTWVQRLPGGELIADHRLAVREGATEVELTFRSKGLVGKIVTMLYARKTRENVVAEARSLKAKCDATA